MGPVFVTGGTGLLGNSIVRELCARGVEVRALCRPGSDPRPLSGLPVQLVKGDLNSEEVLRDAVRGCAATIHSAAFIHIGWQRLEESRQANVQGSARLAKMCAVEGCRMVHVSTVDTLPAASGRDNPIGEDGVGGVAKVPCSYVVSKREAEAEVRGQLERGLDAVIIHPGFMLGPFDWKPSSGRMMVEVHRAPLAVAPPGGCSVCDARDVAAATVEAIERGRTGQNYILAGENLTYQELWTRMLEAAESNKRVWRFGAAIKVVGTLIDSFNRLLPIREGDVNGASIQMGCLNHFYSSELAENELGYHRRPLAETLGDAWQWLSREDAERK